MPQEVSSISIAERIERILALFPEKSWYRELTPFERLVSTILSQNTSREATILGFENLQRRFQITPPVLADASLDEIKECIRPAGLYNTKAPRIKELARVFDISPSTLAEILQRGEKKIIHQHFLK